MAIAVYRISQAEDPDDEDLDVDDHVSQQENGQVNPPFEDQTDKAAGAEVVGCDGHEPTFFSVLGALIPEESVFSKAGKTEPAGFKRPNESGRLRQQRAMYVATARRRMRRLVMMNGSQV